MNSKVFKNSQSFLPQVYLLEKRFTKMIEEKKKQEEATAALQEKLQAAISESSKVSTKILNLKESLKRDEVHLNS
jgi:uncharacterized protein YfcZ (UPF0381/DUF406 family)